MSITQEDLMKFLSNDLAIDCSKVNADTLLFSSGLVDSFSLVSIMTYIEDEGGVTISPSDVKLENFDSISRIMAYLNK